MPETRRLVIEAPHSTIERLAGEALLRRRTAAVFTLECSDGPSPNRTLVKYASEAAAGRIVAEAYPWPCTPEQFTEGLQRLGVKREQAKLVAGQLTAEGSLCEAAEQPRDNQAADWLVSRFGASPHLGVRTIRLVTDAPSTTEVVSSRPPERPENPVGVDTWPELPTKTADAEDRS